MKAMQLEDGALHVRDVDVPEPGAGRGARAHRARRACATPISTSRAATGWECRRMGTLGHEAIGVVEALGPGAERYVEVGDRVILGLGGMGGGYWCGACEYCLSGRPRTVRRAQAVDGHVRRADVRVGARRS